MSRKMELTPHLTKVPSHDSIARTYIGQAHIAGTGPEGRTCRECRWWFNAKGKGGAKPPAYHGPKHPTSPNGLKPAICHRPIANKPRRTIPHDGLACRLFEENPSPPSPLRTK